MPLLVTGVLIYLFGKLLQAFENRAKHAEQPCLFCGRTVYWDTRLRSPVFHDKGWWAHKAERAQYSQMPYEHPALPV
jgi:hypothetical protein